MDDMRMPKVRYADAMDNVRMVYLRKYKMCGCYV